MLQRGRENFHPRWGLANHDTDIHANHYLYGVAFCHSNENQDSCFSNISGGDPLSNANHAGFPSYPMAALANPRAGGADDRDCLRQRGGPAPDSLAPAR